MKKGYENDRLVQTIKASMNNHFMIPPEHTKTLVTEITDLEHVSSDLFMQKLYKKGIILTRRDMDASYMMKQGLTNKEIAVKQTTVNRRTPKRLHAKYDNYCLLFPEEGIHSREQ